MADRHTTSFDYCDLAVDIDDDGEVTVEFTAVGEGVGRIRMNWETFVEAVYFAAIHGLGMHIPTLVEQAATLEAVEA